MGPALTDSPAGWAFSALLVPALIALNAFFVAAEYALVAIRGTQIAELRRIGYRAAALLEVLRADLPGAVAAIQICISLTNLLLGWWAEPPVTAALEAMVHALPLGDSVPPAVLSPVAVGVGFVGVTVLTVVFGELLPKALTLQHTERIALWIAAPIALVRTTLRPLVALMNGLGNLVTRLFGLGPVRFTEHIHSLDELEMLVDESHEAGKLNREQAEILQRTFDLSDRTVGEVMIPRDRMAALHLGMSREQIVETILADPHTRFPVCDAAGGRIVGVVTAKHLLYLLHIGDMLTLSDMVAPVPAFPTTMNLVEALRLMRTVRRHMAVVRGPDRAQLGVITLEDLLAALVGPIPDEPMPTEED
jgi:CBS domain containing-hemolysin-like protein